MRDIIKKKKKEYIKSEKEDVEKIGEENTKRKKEELKSLAGY